MCLPARLQVCCMSAESRNPAQLMPRAVVLTILITSVLSVLAAVALAGMVPYTSMGEGFGFAAALQMNQVGWAATVVEASWVPTAKISATGTWLRVAVVQYEPQQPRNELEQSTINNNNKPH